MARSNLLFSCGGDTLAKYGTLTRRYQIPQLGGEGMKEVFTRTGTAWAVGKNGLLVPHAANVPRVEWVVDPVNAALQPYYLHEGAATTNLIQNGDAENDSLGINGSNGGETISSDTAQAFSGTHAAKVITQNASGSGHWYSNRDGSRIAASAATTYTFSLWIYGTGTAIGKTFTLIFNWWNATPALISSSTSAQVTLVAGWQRFIFTATSPAATVTAQALFDLVAGSIITYWADGAQFEQSAFATSTIPTNTAAVTRNGDSFTVPYYIGNGPIAVYARFLERGGATLNNAGGPAALGSGSVPFSRFDSFLNPGWRWSHQETAGAVVSSAGAPAAYGQVTELLGLTFADGSVQLLQSINAAAQTVGTQSAAQAFTPTYSSPLLTLFGVGFGALSRLMLFSSPTVVPDIPTARAIPV